MSTGVVGDGRFFLPYVFLAMAQLNSICFAEWAKTEKPQGRFLLLTASIGSRFFSGTTDSGVFSSSDSGATWIQAKAGPINMGINSLATIGSDIFAGTGNGVFRSSDAGNTWALSNNGLPYPNAGHLVAIDSILFLECYGKLFRSVDKGDGWTNLNYNGRNDSSVHVIETAGKAVFVGNQNGQFFRSPDYGSTWPLGGIGYVISLLARDEIVIAKTFNNGVLFSSDYGLTWKEIGWEGLNTGVDIRSLILFGNAYYLGTSSGIAISLDKGASWRLVSGQNSPQDVHSFLVIGNDVFAVAGDSSVWKKPISEMASSIYKFDKNAEGKKHFRNIGIFDVSGRSVGTVMNPSLPVVIYRTGSSGIFEAK